MFFCIQSFAKCILIKVHKRIESYFKSNQVYLCCMYVTFLCSWWSSRVFISRKYLLLIWCAYLKNLVFCFFQDGPVCKPSIREFTHPPVLQESAKGRRRLRLDDQAERHPGPRHREVHWWSPQWETGRDQALVQEQCLPPQPYDAGQWWYLCLQV